MKQGREGDVSCRCGVGGRQAFSSVRPSWRLRVRWASPRQTVLDILPYARHGDEAGDQYAACGRSGSPGHTANPDGEVCVVVWMEGSRRRGSVSRGSGLLVLYTNVRLSARGACLHIQRWVFEAGLSFADPAHNLCVMSSVVGRGMLACECWSAARFFVATTTVIHCPLS